MKGAHAKVSYETIITNFVTWKQVSQVPANKCSSRVNKYQLCRLGDSTGEKRNKFAYLSLLKGKNISALQVSINRNIQMR
jgi:hypothetical protein